MDLTPRTVDSAGGTTGPSRNRKSPWAAVVLVLVLVAVGFVAVKALGEASLYYYNVDEAVERRAELGDDRIRLQGTVQDGVRQAGDVVVFDVAFGGAAVEVRHRGDPPELFQPGIPVVLEGRFDGAAFASDRMLIKHSEEYKADNPDRVPTDAP